MFTARSGPAGRYCDRPGCSEPGAVAYGMVPEELLFWLAPLDAASGADGQVLCRRHADSMVVPRLWTLDDRRDPVPRLFSPPVDRQGDASTSPDRVRPEPRSIGAEQLEFPVPTEDSLDPAAVSAAQWRPHFDPSDDLDGLLGAETPLLSRALRGVNRPRP